MLVNPNHRLFDRVPDLFTSPYPGADAYADDAFQMLLARAAGEGSETVGQALLTRAGAQAWNHATQMLWKIKATEVGDVLSDTWPKVAWLDKATGSIAGVLAEVPFPLTTDPETLMSSLVSVALDQALNTISAVPVAGWIIGIVVGIGRMLAPLFEGLLKDDAVPAERRAILPWRAYNDKVDESFVRTFINVDNRRPDWTDLFSPPTKARTWSLADGVGEQGNILGQVLAPFTGKNVAWIGPYGCLPGTFRVAGILQYRGRPQPPDAALRYYRDGTLIHVYGDFTQTGDFFPALQQLAGTVWQQIAAGGPDTYKVHCAQLETLWRDWFSALYTSVFDQGHGDWLLPFLARKVGAEYRLGASAGGFVRAEATDGTSVPLVTRDTFTRGTLATGRTRTPCLYTDIQTGTVRTQSGDLPAKYSREPKTGEYIAPPPSRFARAPGYTCVPWPAGELLLSEYRRADEAIVLPAVRAVAELQRRRLSRTLDCAYVRPEATRDKPIHAAFRDASLKARCLEMRTRLLSHPARFEVDYETAREVDPEYAAALRQSGVPTTAAQRAAAKFQLAGSRERPLEEGGPPLPAPIDPQGGLPFDLHPPAESRRRGTWGAVLGGAAVVSAVAAAVGIARHRDKFRNRHEEDGT